MSRSHDATRGSRIARCCDLSVTLTFNLRLLREISTPDQWRNRLVRNSHLLSPPYPTTTILRNRSQAILMHEGGTSRVLREPPHLLTNWPALGEVIEATTCFITLLLLFLLLHLLLDGVPGWERNVIWSLEWLLLYEPSSTSLLRTALEHRDWSVWREMKRGGGRDWIMGLLDPLRTW